MDGSLQGTRPVFTQAQVKEAQAAGGKIVTHKFGGSGGGSFAPVSLRELRFSTGTMIDAVIINGTRHGGPGGGLADSLRLTAGTQIMDIGYAMNGGILGTLTLYLTDGTKHTYGVPRDETRISQELGCDPKDLRVLALGGWSGTLLDALDAVCVVGFTESTVIAEGQTAIIGAITRGVTLTEYTEASAKKAESYERALSQTHSFSSNASVSGTYFVTASVETEYTYSWSSQTTMARSFEEQLKTAKTVEVRVPDNAYAMLEITNGKIVAPGGSADQSVFIPSGDNETRYILVDEQTYPNLNGFYDLGGYCDTLPADKVRTQQDPETGLMIVETR